jgi:coenzyme F420 hydrogenase subunit beta
MQPLITVEKQPAESLVRTIRTIKDVVDWGLCTGCGACYAACDKKGVTLVDVQPVGIRPQFDASCASCTKCLSICPGYSIDGDLQTGAASKRTEAEHEFGPALEIWEGHATDPEIRYNGSSGGVVSALALYCLDHEDMEFVLHTGMDETKPWGNKTVRSRNRQDLLSRGGSRYAPASPCDGLGSIEEADRPCVFIGKPCDCAAAAMLRQRRPQLDRKLGLVMGFFCAGTPSTKGTLDLLSSLNIPQEAASTVRYRGEGWPGQFHVSYDNRTKERSLSYDESWGKLAGYRPLRCHLCPDGLGRIADISCGDAWNSFDHGKDAGRSLVLVRTERGQHILHRAIAADYVRLKPVNASVVLAAQPNLLGRRKEIFGRLLAMRLMLIPTPKLEGFSLFHSWIRISAGRKLRTILGTMRRLATRGQWRRRPLF